MSKRPDSKDSSQATVSLTTAYGFGFFGQGCRSAYLSFQAYYLLFFLTDGLGLNTYLAAAVYSATQWIKVVTMLMGGVVIDSIPLKGGKFRPWLKWMSIVLFFAFGLMFWNFGLPTAVSIAVFIILFTLDMFSYNTMWVATRGIMGPMCKNSADSGRMAQSQSLCTSIVGLFNSTLYVAVVNYCTSHFKQGYSIAGFIFVGIILICMIPLLMITRPYDIVSDSKTSEDNKKAEKIGFIQMLRSMRGPMIPYFLSHTFATAREGFFYALLTYYTKYVLNNQMVMGYAGTAQSAAGILGALCIPFVEKHIGKKWGFIYGLAAQGLLYFAIAFVGNTAVGYISVRFLLSFINAATGAFGVIQANDIADWQEMHGEKPARGFIQSLSGTTVRAGGVIGSLISSFGFAALGYESGTVPSQSTLDGMVKLLAFGPMVVSLLAAVCFVFYNVDEKALNAWKTEKYALAAQENEQ